MWSFSVDESAPSPLASSMYLFGVAAPAEDWALSEASSSALLPYLFSNINQSIPPSINMSLNNPFEVELSPCCKEEESSMVTIIKTGHIYLCQCIAFICIQRCINHASSNAWKCSHRSPIIIVFCLMFGTGKNITGRMV